MKKPKIIVILGPTATGKSDLAVKVALRLRSGYSDSESLSDSKRSSTKKFCCEVISADSRQVYKGLNIGTGKITKNEMRGIPHHLLDVANPRHKLTVVEYQKKAIYTMTEIISRGNVPIICGGTGFYIDAVTKGIIFPEVPPNIKLRKSLEKNSIEKLYKILLKLDGERTKTIDKNNKVRLIRAIEIVKALGKVPKMKEKILPYHFIKIGLYLPKDVSDKKIEKRVNKMFKSGLLKEVKTLKNKGISVKRLREFGFEYDNPTKERVISETKKYVKRQLTWFKRDKNIAWFDVSKKNFEKKVFTLIQKDF